MQKQEAKRINIQTAVVSKNIRFAFCFQNKAGFNLIFLLTTLKNRVVLSKGPNELLKGPK